MEIKSLIQEIEEGPKYKVGIKFKGDDIETYLTKSDLLNGLLKSTNSQDTIQYLISLVKSTFKLAKVDYKDFFNNLNSLNIINEKTNSSFQINKIPNLSSGDKTDFQIIVGKKKGLEGNSLDDITDKANSDNTKNGIVDARLQAAINDFREIVKRDQ